MKHLTIFALILVFTAIGASAQTEQKPKKNEKENTSATTTAVSKTASPMEIAKAALAAHGGDKLKNMKTLVVRGTAEVSGSPTTTFPATFATIYSGEKYRLEITTPFQPFKQTFDGQNTASSMPGLSLPPLNRLGLPLLPRIEDKDFKVSELPVKSKKKLGFRITSPEGFYTDFFIDERTGLVKSYESSYEFNGRSITTSVEIDKLREVDGVKIPERYAQRFDTGQIVIYSDFKAKEILVNSAVADDVFSIGK